MIIQNAIRQYRKGLYQYAMRIRFKYGKDATAKFVMRKNIGRFSPIYVNSESCWAKLEQYKKMLKKIRIDARLKYGFIYFIDDKCVPCNLNATIDNMPIDYSVIVKRSLDDIKKENEKAGNETAKRNIYLINLIEKFIDRISKTQTEDNAVQINWLLKMKNEKAGSLDEALQRILFWNQMLWQTDHLLNGLGRLDKVLEDFASEENLDDKLVRFLRTLHCYYEYKSNSILGDTGQVIILGGKEPDGGYFCNKITYGIIKALTDIRTPDPKVLLRVSANVPESLLDITIECIATGCGSPLLSNDEVVIPAIEKFGYSHDDASNYGVSACWEPLIIGNSLEQNNLFDIEFGKVFEDTYKDEKFCACESMGAVVDLYKSHLIGHLEGLIQKLDMMQWEKDPICSLFNRNSLQSDKDMADGGSCYNNYGLLSIGLSSVVDSFINIERYVFGENVLSLSELVECLKNNYLGQEKLQQKFAKNKDCFGSAGKRAVYYTEKIMDIVDIALSQYRNKFGGKVKYGLSSPAYVNGGLNTSATADGRNTGTPFHTHISREKDTADLLELVEFAGQLNYGGIRSNGNVVDAILQPTLISEKPEIFRRYIKSSIKCGFFQMQFNVLSYEKLIDAKRHPEKYPELMVRVWGFSAYFSDIPESYQDALIKRAKEMWCA